MLLRTITVIGLGLFLSGCMTVEQQRTADEEKCRSYGFTRKNDAFAECLQRLELDRRAAARENRYVDPFPRVIYRPVYVPVQPK
ncbi:hypothetical protein MIC97_11755 [Aquamicrobium sp. NLF2-7]|jgi:hypothetical protein|uniref:Lipoprotein n=1 Tax=Aquamicrobium lusatiense TaxID=89772 RepID=A0A7W9RZM0_9HYPH|nr:MULTISPECIES: hypothetical protein [Aquamicrobium]MBB6011437.1 hypothetical protein [Aquamicrobium lusatiense]MCG8272178.1 hypothetical protein [Aquamicrobium sp. NLF2-7]MCK9552193.1 hypothetical protein [Aquamicrobium sp.]